MTQQAGLIQAQALLEQVGPNELRREAARPVWRILLAQYLST